jgi:hypothetical protein
LKEGVERRRVRERSIQVEGEYRLHVHSPVPKASIVLVRLKTDETIANAIEMLKAVPQL